jgi:hypothetical protein
MATLIQLCWKFLAVERSWYVQVIALLSGISMKPPNLFSPQKKSSISQTLLSIIKSPSP